MRIYVLLSFIYLFAYLTIQGLIHKFIYDSNFIFCVHFIHINIFLYYAEYFHLPDSSPVQLCAWSFVELTFPHRIYAVTSSAPTRGRSSTRR